jgi:DNA-binding MarR family transcriptional regulator
MNKKEFFLVPNAIFEWGLSGSEMLVLMYLLRCADTNTRLCYPSYDKIRKSCKMTKSTAIKAIDKLCYYNIVEKVSIGHYEEYKHKANTYRINNIFKTTSIK